MAKGNKPHGASLPLACMAILSWMFFSSAIIFLNSNLYAMGFERPFFVTGAGQLFSAFGGLVLVALGVLPLRKLPSARFIVTRLLPIVLSATVSKFFGNNSYLYLSVSFIQILKAFTPALTLLLCALMGLERLHWALALSVLLIAFGTAIAVVSESGQPMFSAWGLVSFLISSIAEASRVVGAGVLLGGSLSAEVLVYVGGPTAILLLLGSLIWEDMGPGSQGWSMIMADPLPYAAAFSVSFLLNLSSFISIQNTSSLTFKVAGCLKNVAVVGYSVVANQERVTWLQVCGYMVSVAGFFIYSKLKMATQPPKTKAKAA